MRRQQRGQLWVALGLCLTAGMFLLAGLWMRNANERHAGDGDVEASSEAEQEARARLRELEAAWEDKRLVLAADLEAAKVRVGALNEGLVEANEDRKRASDVHVRMMDELAELRAHFEELTADGSLRTRPLGLRTPKQPPAREAAGTISARVRFPGHSGTWPVELAGRRLSPDGEGVLPDPEDAQSFLRATLMPEGTWSLAPGSYELDARLASTYARIPLPRLKLDVKHGEDTPLIFSIEVPEDVAVLDIGPQLDAQVLTSAAQHGARCMLFADRLEPLVRGEVPEREQVLVSALHQCCPLAPGRYRIQLAVCTGPHVFLSPQEEVTLVGGKIKTVLPVVERLAALYVGVPARGPEDAGTQVQRVRIDPDGGGPVPSVLYAFPSDPTQIAFLDNGNLGWGHSTDRGVLVWVPPGGVLLHVRGATARWEQAVVARGLEPHPVLLTPPTAQDDEPDPAPDDE